MVIHMITDFWHQGLNIKYKEELLGEICRVVQLLIFFTLRNFISISLFSKISSQSFLSILSFHCPTSNFQLGVVIQITHCVQKTLTLRPVSQTLLIQKLFLDSELLQLLSIRLGHSCLSSLPSSLPHRISVISVHIISLLFLTSCPKYSPSRLFPP